MNHFKSLIICCLFITNIVRSQVSVYAKVDHLEPDGVDTLGNITLTVSGSTAPYTYTWNPGAINTKDISNITAGQYTLNVRSTSNQTYTNKYNIGYKVKWTGLERCTFRNDSLVSTSGGGAYCKAVSQNVLPSGTNGWFEYVISSTTGITYIGFCDSVMPLINQQSDIDFGIHLYNNLSLYAYESGTGHFLSGSAKIGDVLKVERNGDVITYRLNGNSVKTVTVSGVSSKSFRLKAAMNGTEKLLNVGCSFIPKGNSYFPNFAIGIPTITHATGTGTNDGSINFSPGVSGSYTYSWSTGTTTNSVTGLNTGLYKLGIVNSDTISFSKYYNVGYKSQWTNLDRCFFRNDSLISNTGSVSLYSSAVSKNTLPSGTDGWFEFVFGTITNKIAYIGFLDSIAPLHSTFNDIDYGFKINNDGSLSCYEGGTVIYNTGQRTGDVLRLERIGNTIYYKINGVTIRSLTAGNIGAKILKMKVSMSYPFSLTNIGCSFLPSGNINFPNYVNAKPVIKHLSSPGSADGSVKVTPLLAGSHTYTWQPSGVNTNSITGQDIGQYKVIIEDSLNNQSSKYYNIGYKTKWTNFYKNFLRNDTLISTATSNLFSSACSKNTLRPNTNGWFEYTLGTSGNNHVYLGFTIDTLSPNASDRSDVDYGIFLNSSSNTSFYYYESGTQAIIYFVLKANDIIRVERIGNTINYKVNGVTLRTVTVSGLSSKALKLATVLQNNERIANVGCSFYNIDSTAFGNYVRVNPTIKHCSGIGINDGSIQLSGAISYTWQPGGQTTNTISLLNSGMYSVTVGDNLINTSAYNYNVAYKTKWTNLSNCFFRNDTLKGTGSSYSISGYAYSKNILSATTDGYFEYVLKGVPASNNVVYIGFTDTTSHSLSTLTEIKYGFYLDGNNKYLYYYEGGSNASIYPYPRAGDVLRIERIGNTINYRVNGLIMRTVTVSTIGANVYKLKARLTHNNELVNVGVSFPECDLNVSAGTTQTITTLSPSVTLTGTTSLTSGATYSWSPGGSTPTSSTTVVSSGGIYTLKITNALGCSNASTVKVLGDVSVFNNTYVTLKPKLDGGYYQVNDGKLYFKFREEYENTNNQLNYKIYDKNRAVVISNTTAGATLNLLYKDNRFTLDVLGIAPSMPNGYYVLEVEDKKGQISMLRFKL